MLEIENLMLLYQPKDGYCYNSDSLLLYNFINSLKPRKMVLDVGAGCGVVGLLVARDNPKVILNAVEKQSAFVELSTINARVNNIPYNIQKNDFTLLDDSVKYDYIISNPPFYHESKTLSKNEMIYYARYSIHLPLQQFFKKVSQLLKPHSHFVFCYDASQFGLICVELEKVKLRVVEVQFVHPKADKVASLVLIHARNGSSSMMKVMQPFISFNGGAVSDELQEIYLKASTHSIKCEV